MKNDNDITALTSAAFLGSMSKALNHWSMLSAVATLLLLGLKQASVYSAVCLAASCVVALLQGYFAARCAFDAAVFAALGGESSHYDSFDTVLTRWRLRGANTGSRSLNERVQGAIRLLRWQGFSFIAQIVLLVMGLLIA